MSPPADESRRPVEHRFALAAWDREPSLVDETNFTAWAEPGWSSWNRMSPELEFCEFVVALVRVLRPAVVIETGTGQGYLTRRLKPLLAGSQRLVCFEEDPGWREALATLAFFDDPRVELSPEPMPSEQEFSEADVCILDSGQNVRSSELDAWWRHANPGAVAVVHDVSEHHPPGSGHAAIARVISDLGIPGLPLANPRGGFLALKPGPRAALRSSSG